MRADPAHVFPVSHGRAGKTCFTHSKLLTWQGSTGGIGSRPAADLLYGSALTQSLRLIEQLKNSLPSRKSRSRWGTIGLGQMNRYRIVSLSSAASRCSRGGSALKENGIGSWKSMVNLCDKSFQNMPRRASCSCSLVVLADPLNAQNGIIRTAVLGYESREKVSQ